jgi:8-oxo-dGTP diphosphatase
MAERFFAKSAVFVALLDKKGRVLLHRRYNTGYMDGRYDLPSGHVEQGEPLLQAAVRELQEETGVAVKSSNLTLRHINQFSANGEEYYNFFFTATIWQGEPTVMEPAKCDDVQFFPLNKLPPLTAATHVALLDLAGQKVTFGFIDQAVYDEIAA